MEECARGAEGGSARPRTVAMLPYCAAQCKGFSALQHYNRHQSATWATAVKWPLTFDHYHAGCRTMKARIKWIEKASFVAETGSGHAVIVDGAPDAGGRNLGARPMELVLAGAAACTAFDVVWILKKARQRITDCVVEAQADRAAVEPKVFTRIHLKYRVAGNGLDSKQVERAVKLSKEKYCSATIMLARGAEITFEVEIVEGDRLQ